MKSRKNKSGEIKKQSQKNLNRNQARKEQLVVVKAVKDLKGNDRLSNTLAESDHPGPTGLKKMA